MNRTFYLATAVFIALTIISAHLARAEEALPTGLPEPEVAPAVEPEPNADAPQFPPEWTYERQIQNPQGSVTNTHRYLDAPDEGRYIREHIVNNPRGEMTQTWERMSTEEGYQFRRSQTWTAPDGTPMRQHERTMSGSEPYNYTRQHSVMLRDGRTIQPSIAVPGESTMTAEPAKRVRWWDKLNPLAKNATDPGQSASVAAPRRGFTIGTPGLNPTRASSFGSGEHRPVLTRQNTHGPWWAGGLSRSMRTQGPPAHANGISNASRPKPASGTNR